MSLLLKVACPGCGFTVDSAALGAELLCARCGRDFRAAADGENGSRVLSVTPDELDHVPYSQRCIEVPVNSVSPLIQADAGLLQDKLLREAPLKENSKWVGKVRLLKKLGHGGMSAVYRGYDESLALDVAVKIFPFPMGERDEKWFERFRQEARISARIDHPNVVRTLRVDEEGDLIYLVMDLIEGQTARQLVDAKGPLTAPLALQIVLDATRGLQAAHEHGVVHRDIKPENILIANDGRVLLSDLGLARAVSRSGGGAGSPLTRVGLLMGTPEYMSPEQWEIGADAGPLSDIWSMGATLWMLLAHSPPYHEQNMGALAQQIRDSVIPDIGTVRPGLPANLVYILKRCLAKNPQERFGSASALINALNDALIHPDGEVTEAMRAGAVTPILGCVPAGAENSPIQTPAAAIASPRPALSNVQIHPRPALKPRMVLAAGVMLLLAIGGAWVWVGSRGASVVPLLDLRYPPSVRPGGEAELLAVLNGIPDPKNYGLFWLTGDRTFIGSSVRVPLEHDTEFTLIVREKSTAREVLKRTVKVNVELQVHGADNDFYQIESGSALKLDGSVIGGAAGQMLDMRWSDAQDPEKTLSSTLQLEVPKSDIEIPGRHVYVLQSKRKEDANWSAAAESKITVEITRRIPPEFTAKMQEGTQARESAARANHGEDVTVQWRQALVAFERAAEIFPDDQAKTQAEACRERLDMEEKYLALLHEARRLKKTAEKVSDSDGMPALAAWSEVLRPCSAALALFDSPEARGEAAAVEAKVAELKLKLGSAEQERVTFESMVAKARHSTREAKKYVSFAVALPHWEQSLSGFMELSKRFPKRADEFLLEMREAQESRDKAYLYEVFGVVESDKPADVIPKQNHLAALPAPTQPGNSAEKPVTPIAAPPKTVALPAPVPPASKTTVKGPDSK